MGDFNDVSVVRSKWVVMGFVEGGLRNILVV